MSTNANHAAIHVTIMLQGMPHVHAASHIVIHAASRAALCYGHVNGHDDKYH